MSNLEVLKHNIQIGYSSATGATTLNAARGIAQDIYKILDGIVDELIVPETDAQKRIDEFVATIQSQNDLLHRIAAALGAPGLIDVSLLLHAQNVMDELNKLRKPTP